MAWRKLGRLFEAPAVHPKLLSHAANPLPVRVAGARHRVFYSGRDAQNRSSVGWVDIDLDRLQVLDVCSQPAFEFGPEGSFYSHGVSIGNCYEAQGRRYMLFMGWQQPPGEHWRGDIGRLVVGDDLSLRLDGDGPFLGLDGIDPVSLSYPWVERQGAGWRMWYGSTLVWDAGNREMLHVINQASSDDGHAWRREGLAVPFGLGLAQAFSRPTVARDGRGGFDMWFSYRDGLGTPYRIGRASSSDGQAWRLRLADSGIDVSPSGWDSEMIEYPYVFSYQEDLYMLYNGNGYGRTGFGLARYEHE
jgi:hypothetical protein